MINRNKLLGKMAETGHTQKSLSAVINCTENTFSGKITGKYEFKLSEAAQICDVLGIDSPTERAQIFLPNRPENGSNHNNGSA